MLVFLTCFAYKSPVLSSSPFSAKNNGTVHHLLALPCYWSFP